MNNKLVISLLALLVIVLAIFVFTMSSNVLVSPKSFEREITQVETVSDSDEVESIEVDLEKTDLDNLDSELTDIEMELN